MSNAAYMRQRRAEAKATGRCVVCLNHPAIPRQDGQGLSARCASCSAKEISRRPYSYESTRARRDALKARGICVESGCGGHAVPGRIRCDYHLERNAESELRRQDRRAAQREARKNLTPAQVDNILGTRRTA